MGGIGKAWQALGVVIGVAGVVGFFESISEDGGDTWLSGILTFVGWTGLIALLLLFFGTMIVGAASGAILGEDDDRWENPWFIVAAILSLVGGIAAGISDLNDASHEGETFIKFVGVATLVVFVLVANAALSERKKKQASSPEE
jgi:hypothetical protein